MSLITCCPACGTMFKVVADQLRISEGWVRCGYCSDVFDAAANLRDEAELPWRPSPPAEPPGMPPDTLAEPGFDSQPPDGAASEQHEVPDSPDDALPDSAAAVALPATVPMTLPEAGLQPAATSPDSVPSSTFDEPAPVVSFVRDAQRKAFWRRPLVRALLGLTALLLLLALAAQFAYVERDRIAAMEPRTAPWLARMCEPLGCRIEPLRQIESIVIDSSSFNRIRDDAHRLNITIRNTSPLELAMPSFELVLTDVQDQTLVRRVFSAAELGNEAATLGGGSDWSGSVAVAVGGNGRTARVAGYRLLAFYP